MSLLTVAPSGWEPSTFRRCWWPQYLSKLVVGSPLCLRIASSTAAPIERGGVCSVIQRELGGARLERRSWIIDHAAEEPQVVLSMDDLVGGRRLATSFPRLHVTRGQEALDDLALVCLLAELPAQCLSHGCVVLAEDEPLEDDEPAEVLRVHAASSGRAGRTDRRK